MNLRVELERRLSAALAACGAPAGAPAMVSPAVRAEFGDYQANGVMPAAKAMNANPRELAAKVLAAADLSDLAEKTEVAGAGFINITLRCDWLANRTAVMLSDDRLGVEKPTIPQTVVVDYSGPNLAKEMHVGHLRSTIIGDALARVLEFTGHNVIRQNHVGDWGTQFGTVILGIWHICMARKRSDWDYISTQLSLLSELSQESPKETRKSALQPLLAQQREDLAKDPDGTRVFHPFVKDIVEKRSLELPQLEEAYRLVNKIEELAQGTGLIIDTTPYHKQVPLSDLSRYITSHFLQNPSDPRNKQELDAWTFARELTLESCQAIYRRLGVQLTSLDARGESFYRQVPIQQPDGILLEEDWLSKVIEDLQKKELLTESHGAQCVFLPEFKDKDGETLPLIVQKSDEGYLYATTDLAAIRYRVGTLKADRILYVTDSRQALHFQQVFAVARAAGFAPGGVSLEHVAFGMMLGGDGRPFRTRQGGTVKLMELLDEAEGRAFALVSEKNPQLSEDLRRQIARAVGIGAVKYADLSQNRTSDYVFSWDKMLSLDGNTAPYMQYAYARIRSIFRRGGSDRAAAGQIIIADPAERALALKLVGFPEVMATVASECLPNLLCAYLYDLAGRFMGFYENCPVLQSQEPLRSSRLRLCELTARTIRTGLNLVGIDTIEQM
jgi:arginyl-tRNA synthetase